MAVRVSFAIRCPRAGWALLLALGLTSCGQSDVGTTLPANVMRSQMASTSSAQRQAGLRADISGTSAVFRDNPGVVDLQDVILAFALSKTPVNERGDRDLAVAANRLLLDELPIDNSFSGLDATALNFITSKSLSNSSQPDLLDVATLYAATVIPSEQLAKETLAETVNKLIPGQNINPEDIAALPPNLPSDEVTTNGGETLREAVSIENIEPTDPEEDTVSTKTTEVTGEIDNIGTNRYYQFELDRITNVEIVLGDLTEDSKLEVIQDLNGNGELDSGEVFNGVDVFSSSNSETFRSTLDPGVYIIRVLPKSLEQGSLEYKLSINTTLPASNILTQDPGNSLASAAIIERLDEEFRKPQIFYGFVDPIIDISDYYRFDLELITSVNVTLGDLNNNGKLKIVRDLNSNQELDAGEVINEVNLFSSSASEEFNSFLDPGSYYIQVLPANLGQDSVGYKLTIEAVPTNLSTVDRDPGESPGTAAIVGNLSASQGSQAIKEFYGFVDPSTDASDYYQFEIDRTTNIDITLGDLTNDGKLEVVQDLNANGELDPGERLSTVNMFASTSSERFTASLSAGIYFVRVSPANQGQDSAGYKLTIDATP